MVEKVRGGLVRACRSPAQQQRVDGLATRRQVLSFPCITPKATLLQASQQSHKPSALNVCRFSLKSGCISTIHALRGQGLEAC